MFGPQSRERIAFLAENGQAWLSRIKARPRRRKPVPLSEKTFKNVPKWDGRNRVWTAQAQADSVLWEIRGRQAWALKRRVRAQ